MPVGQCEVETIEEIQARVATYGPLGKATCTTCWSSWPVHMEPWHGRSNRCGSCGELSLVWTLPDEYYCPTSGEVESAENGGFDTCCSHPELHRLL